MSDQNKISPLSNKLEVLKKQKKHVFAFGGLLLVVFFIFFFTSQMQEDKPKEKPAVHLESKDENSHPPQLINGNNQKNTQAKTTEPLNDDLQDKLLRDQQQIQELEIKRMVASTQVYSDSSAQAKTPNQNAAQLGGNTGDINSQFQAQVSSAQVPISKATRLLHPESMLAQGAMIWATLETRISSDLPGMLRAVTSDDIYSEDGSQVLLPKGSRLIGQYTNAISQGQSRVFVVWQRAIRPDHIDIQLGSTGTDTLGAAGIGADDIDTHFFARFGQAVLLSIIGAGASNSGVSSDTQFNSAASYREAISASFAESAKQSLKQNGNIQPTISIEQGKKISVFVARDLDFSAALKSRSTKSIERNY